VAEIIGHLYPYTADLRTVGPIITLYDDGLVILTDYIDGGVYRDFRVDGLTAREVAAEIAQDYKWVLLDKPFNNARNCETCPLAKYRRPRIDDGGGVHDAFAACLLTGEVYEQSEIIRMGIEDCAKWVKPDNWPTT